MHRLLILAALAFTACSSASASQSEEAAARRGQAGGCPFYAPDAKPGRGMPTGFYGQLVVGCDSGNCRVSCLADAFVGVFAREPALKERATPITAARTDALGVYRVEVEPGDWFACVGSFADETFRVTKRCTRLTVGSGRPARHDFVTNPTGGSWL
jgi:hypothetical protein